MEVEAARLCRKGRLSDDALAFNLPLESGTCKKGVECVSCDRDRLSGIPFRLRGGCNSALFVPLVIGWTGYCTPSLVSCVVSS